MSAEQALNKIRSEMNSNGSNAYIQAVGQFLIQHVTENPNDAGAILSTDKTIAKSLEAMRKAAEKKKVGNVAVLTDAEGFAVVLTYFKTAATAPQEEVQPAPEAPKDEKPKRQRKPKPAPEPEPEPEEDTEEDIDFDSLLL